MADFQEAHQLGGVFVQDAAGDRDATTSDGIFVATPGALPLAVGDQVRVTGTVQEAFGLTLIGGVTGADCGDAVIPAPTPLVLPADDPARERLEGMLVTLAGPVTATETFNLGRFGELVVSAGGRLYVPTNGTGISEEGNDRRRLVVDDASNVQNPDDIPFAEPGDVIRLGDTLVDVVGVLSYGFGAYRLQPTQPATVLDTNPRPPAPDPVGGNVQVASFNVLNYFTTVDDGDPFPRGLPRGADTATELQRQRAKLVEAIATLDADVVGLMEIENDEDDAAVDDLVAALDTRMGPGTYAAVEEPVAGGTGPLGGTFGDDAIKVAMIYKPAVVRPLGPALTTTDPAFANAQLPLAQAFKPVAPRTVPFTVVVNHFKSKSCGTPAPGPGDPNADTGQGCFNGDRLAQAGALLDLLADVATNRVLVIGDLNSYGEED
ncbi:MAG: ExeM/NucH family extracellular endonuclease, partial [Acidimicrobiales bacterium]